MRRGFHGAAFFPSIPKPPKYLYHGTSTVRLPRIVKKGLRPQTIPGRWGMGIVGKNPALARRVGNRQRLNVHLTGTAKGALFWAKHAANFFGGYPVVLRIRADDPRWNAVLERDPALWREQAWVTMSPVTIPAESIEVCKPRRACRSLGA